MLSLRDKGGMQGQEKEQHIFRTFGKTTSEGNGLIWAQHDADLTDGANQIQ